MLAASIGPAAEIDRAISPLMTRAAPNMTRVRVLQRTRVDPETDLVVAFGAPKNYALGTGDGDWWSSKTALGLFLQRRDKPDLVYQISVGTGLGEGDCFARVERATATGVVISCTPEKGSHGPNRKFIYDLRAKALVKQIDYDPFAMNRVFVSGDRAVLVGSDFTRLIALEFNPANSPEFRVLQGAEEERWKARVRTSESTIGAGAALRKEVYVEPEQFKPVSFGPGNRFTLTQNDKAVLHVLERTGQRTKRHELPPSSYDEFAAARPGHVKDGYSRRFTQLGGAIGPWQIDGESLWFGKSFYDGEGMTGIGGFGYFDGASAQFRLFSPPAIADSSVTAILVEPGAVWLALAHRGEWGGTAQGLLRFDRATEKVKKIELRDIAGQFARVAGRLLIATQFGAAVLEEDGKLRRFFVDRTAGGRWRVVEAIHGQ